LKEINIFVHKVPVFGKPICPTAKILGFYPLTEEIIEEKLLKLHASGRAKLFKEN
jgi:hypothetical protein